MRKQLTTVMTISLMSFILIACGKDENLSTEDVKNISQLDSETVDVTNNQKNGDKKLGPNMDGKISHSDVTHSTWGHIPEGLKEAENPKFKVGDQVIIQAAHDDDMQGAKGTIVGAYQSTVYSISYQPTTGEEMEENDKWFVREEIAPLGEEELKEGSKVIIGVARKEGMQGAEGIIDTAEETVVYMVDYTDKEGNEVKNYQWFKESELSPAQ